MKYGRKRMSVIKKVIIGLLVIGVYDTFIERLSNYFFADNISVMILFQIGVFVVFVLFFIIFLAVMKNRRRTNFFDSPLPVIDQMGSKVFNNYVYLHLKEMDYSIRRMKKSAEYGITFTAKKNGEKILIVSLWSDFLVGVDKIQELDAALFCYKADHAIIITNSYFTKNAIDMADVRKIELWDRETIGKTMVTGYQEEKVKVSNQMFHRIMRENTCQYCEGRMILRYGTFGEFYGCSNYPRCKFTRNKA